MKLNVFLTGVALLAGTSLATPAAAQQVTAPAGSPAFRVPLKDGATDPGVPKVYTWLETVSSCSTTCGTGTRTTSYQCTNVGAYDWQGGGYGAPAAPSECTAAIGPAPASSSESCTVYTSCSYDWVVPSVTRTATPPGRVGCGQVRSQFDPFCRRSDGVVVAKGDHAMCSSDRPDYDPVAAGNPDALGFDRTAVDTSSCAPADHEWKTGSWSSYSSQCSATSTRTRTVSCERKFDGATVADAECGGTKPATSETQPIYDGCSYAWNEGGWSAWSSGCSAAATRTRSVTCERNGEPVADSSCPAAKPTTTETAARYDDCGYTPTYSSWGACTNGSQTRTMTDCVRSDSSSVALSNCVSAGHQNTQTQSCTPAVTYSWESGSWTDWSNHCSETATRTRSVVCRGSDGSVGQDNQCTGTKPRSYESTGVYDQCGFTPYYGSWSACSNDQRTQTMNQCVRDDGSGRALSECVAAGHPMTRTESCVSTTYDWSYGSWSAWSSSCSASATRSRSVTCQSSTGSAVADSNCNAGTRQPSTETQGIYSGCGYTPTYGSYGACSNGTQSRSMASCTRSDGASVSTSECVNAGHPSTTSQSCTVTTYDWVAGGFGPWSSTCSSSATRTQSVTCQRNDGATVSDSFCTGTRPPSSETQGVYSSCSYAPTYGSYGTCVNGTQSRSMTSCTRSDGADVATSFCTNSGSPATQSQSCTVTTYDWVEGGFGAWSSSCSAAATRSQSVTCRRNDGVTVSDGFCTGTRPASTQTQAIYTGCSYSPVDRGTGACTNGQRPHYWDCTRSDGTEGFPASMCGKTNPEYEACGTYAWAAGGWGAPSNTCGTGAQTRSVFCQRNDGAAVADSFCSGAGARPDASQPITDYSGCGYAKGDLTAYGPWSSQCSANATRTNTYNCRRSDGTVVASSECTSRGVSLTENESGAVYSGCSYTPTYGSYGTCSGGTQSAPMTGCTRSDGTGVATSFCTGAGHPASQTQSCQQASPAVGFYISISQSPQGSPSGGYYYGSQSYGPSLGALPNNRQQPYQACSYFGYTVNMGDEFDNTHAGSVANTGSNMCFEFIDGNTTSPPTVFDGAGTTRTIYWRKP